MKRLIKNKSVLHRMTALVMAVVMILTLVAIDSHFNLFAGEEVASVDITTVLNGEDGQMVSGLSQSQDFKFTSQAVDGLTLSEVYYKEFDNDIPDKVGTPTDADGYLKIGTEDKLKDKTKPHVYAFFKPELNDGVKTGFYTLIGKMTLSFDNQAPTVDNDFVLKASSDKIHTKEGYYLLNDKSTETARFEISANDDSKKTATGIDRVVYKKSGSEAETELTKEDDKYIFQVPEESGSYTFKAYDKAGNPSDESSSLVIKKLNGVPVITDVTLTPITPKTLNGIKYLVSDTSVNVAVKITKSTAGIDNTEVGCDLFYKFIKEDEDYNTEGGMKKAVTGDTATFEIPVAAVDADGYFNRSAKTKRKVVVSVADEFGNNTLWQDLSGNIVFVDNGKPDVTVSAVSLKRGDGSEIAYDKAPSKWANSVKLGVSASNNYSYIDSMSYSYSANGEDVSEAIGEQLFDYDVQAQVEVVKGTSSDNTEDRIALPDGKHTITFSAKNYAGGTGSKSVDVYIDNAAPEIELNTNANTTVVDGVEYYAFINSSVKMNIKWTDMTSGVDATADTVKVKLVKAGSQGKDQYLHVVFDGDGTAHAGIDKDTRSGIYVMQVAVTDKAGNKKLITADKKIFVNRSDLSGEISAKADGAPVTDGQYVSADKVVVTCTAEGYCLAKDDIIIQDNGTDITKNCISSLKTDSESAVNKVTYKYVVSNADSNMQGGHKVVMYVKNHGSIASDPGNYDKNFACTFTYDTTAPVINVTKPAAYQNKSVALKWTSSDNIGVKNIYVEGTRQVYTYSKTSGQVSMEEYDVYEKLSGKDTRLVFTDGGRYTLSVWAVDAAGNKSKESNVSFVIDRQNAVLEYEDAVTEPSADRCQKQTIKFVIHDAYVINAGDVTLTCHYITYDNKLKGDKKYSFTQKDKYTLVASVTLKQIKGKAARYNFAIDGCDRAGNSSIDAGDLTSKRYYIDSTLPEISLDPVPEETNDGYYNSNVEFDIAIKEQFNKKHKLVIIDANGNAAESKKYFEYNDYLYGASYSKEGEYNLNIEVTDACGNITTTNTNFVIDKTNPVVTLGRVNSINNSDVTLPVSFTDNMMGAKYTVHVTRTDASGNKSYDGDQESGSWEGTSFAKNIVFSAEGDYIVTVSAEDKAGNKSEAATAKFRIDRTAPVISITGVEDRQATTCTATISVDEAFSFTYEGSSLAGDAISVSITKKTDGTAATDVAKLSTANFSAGNPHSAAYSITEDGEYTITANAKDLAGNVAASVTKTFKVDSKAPVVKVAAYDKDSKTVNSYDAVGSQDLNTPNYVDVALSVEESFFKTDNVKITVKKDGKDVSGTYFTNYSNSAAVSTGSQRFSEDGAYDITVTAQDEIGNKAEDFNMVFTVDNTAPQVEETAALQKMMAKAGTGEDGSVLLNADDFADIASQGYEALWNVNDTSVFTVDVKMDGVDLIDFSDLTDGYHKIVATVTDEVDHVTTKEFDFTYDGTAPRIIITGVEDGEAVREPFTMTIGLENEEDEITSIVINGNTIDPADYQLDNKYEMQVEEYNTYTIEVEAKDKAGNIATTFNKDTGEVFTFKLSEKISPVILIIIIIAALLLIALLIFIIIVGKKKKKKSA